MLGILKAAFKKVKSIIKPNINEKYLRELRRHINKINALEADIKKLTNEELKNKTTEFKERLDKGATEDDILEEAFAVVREAAFRTLGLRPFDVQVMGGIALHKGMVAEMRTGEGKTLVATLPSYLNAISGKGAYVITVNDYLAKRDAEIMAPIHEFLGLSVGCIVSNMQDEERKKNYNCHITYGTNSEFGFDYLRDNMKFYCEEMVQRPFNFVLIDEVDSVLIDEARTPLIISGSSDDATHLYVVADEIVKKLAPEDYEKDDKSRNCHLTEVGCDSVERMLKEKDLIKPESNLFDYENLPLMHYIHKSLIANTMFQPNVHYLVTKKKEVAIIDEFSGRIMDGRRYSDGLHQAIEAKEGVKIQKESQTLASITYQNFFKLFPKMCGMTGTADTEAVEFVETYKMPVVTIPSNLKLKRMDYNDEIYLTIKDKYNAVIKLIEERSKAGQPILVGTSSIEQSEDLSNLLKSVNIKHQVLNAKFHEQEAQIIGEAGIPGAVTIATNMAGRGTDIQLGGNLKKHIEKALENVDPEDKETIEKIKIEEKKIWQEQAKIATEAGGLYVIGTERHESRRIDNQLRGRTARQGDPGCSKFFLSLEDNLMRTFGASDRMMSIFKKMGMESNGEPISHRLVTGAIERAQKQVQAQHKNYRQQVLKYDNVMNEQRKVVYEQRYSIMKAPDVRNYILGFIDDIAERSVEMYCPKDQYSESWNFDALNNRIKEFTSVELPIQEWREQEILQDTIIEKIKKLLEEKLKQRDDAYSENVCLKNEKSILLNRLDELWKAHLLTVDHIRQGVNWRAYAQKDPFNEYKKDAFFLFNEMLENLKTSVLKKVLSDEINVENNKNNPFNFNLDELLNNMKLQQDEEFEEENETTNQDSQKYLNSNNQEDDEDDEEDDEDDEEDEDTLFNAEFFSNIKDEKDLEERIRKALMERFSQNNEEENHKNIEEKNENTSPLNNQNFKDMEPNNTIKEKITHNIEENIKSEPLTQKNIWLTPTRNSLCSCSSGYRYKDCCFGKTK